MYPWGYMYPKLGTPGVEWTVFRNVFMNYDYFNYVNASTSFHSLQFLQTSASIKTLTVAANAELSCSGSSRSRKSRNRWHNMCAAKITLIIPFLWRRGTSTASSSVGKPTDSSVEFINPVNYFGKGRLNSHLLRISRIKLLQCLHRALHKHIAIGGCRERLSSRHEQV